MFPFKVDGPTIIAVRGRIRQVEWEFCVSNISPQRTRRFSQRT